MRRALQLVLTLILLSVPAGAAFAQESGTKQGAQDPAAVVTAFVNAVSAHNTDAALALVAENAVVTLKISESMGAPAPDVLTGKAQIRAAFIDSAPAGLQVVSVQISGNTATATLSADANEALRSVGLTQMGFVLVATVENGLIQTATLDFTPETKTAVQVISSGPAGPAVGMPTTGSGDQAPLLASLALVAVLLTGAGLFLARRRA